MGDGGVKCGGTSVRRKGGTPPWGEGKEYGGRGDGGCVLPVVLELAERNLTVAKNSCFTPLGQRRRDTSGG